MSVFHLSNKIRNKLAHATHGNGFIGDLLGSVLAPAGALLGNRFGGPVGGAAGGFLGDQAAGLARRLPFKKGGKVSKKSAPAKPKTKKAKGMVKGSKEAKEKMAKLRAMKKK